MTRAKTALKAIAATLKARAFLGCSAVSLLVAAVCVPSAKAQYFGNYYYSGYYNQFSPTYGYGSYRTPYGNYQYTRTNMGNYQVDTLRGGGVSVRCYTTYIGNYLTQRCY